MQVWNGPQVPDAVKPSKGCKYLPTQWDNAIIAAGWNELAEDNEEE